MSLHTVNHKHYTFNGNAEANVHAYMFQRLSPRDFTEIISPFYQSRFEENREDYALRGVGVLPRLHAYNFSSTNLFFLQHCLWLAFGEGITCLLTAFSIV